MRWSAIRSRTASRPFIHAAFAAQTGEPVVYERLLCPLDGFTAAVREFAPAARAAAT
jgi:shikimate 5-dehydrogenase